jgi:hypothetical protein
MDRPIVVDIFSRQTSLSLLVFPKRRRARESDREKTEYNELLRVTDSMNNEPMRDAPRVLPLACIGKKKKKKPLGMAKCLEGNGV